ncbi:MAG TPA: ketose-bisphosphate aldolase [Spirochaetota bacterium]|nr:ketose-bisphosphate aldolase [Spirochaetota bacterium]
MHYTEIGFVNTKDMFRKAYEGGYAVPAYNFVNMEQLQAIVQACVESRSPVILQASKRVRQYVGREFVRRMAQAAVELIVSSGSSAPCALHLDHGDSPEECARSIDDGFSSVMIDGSALPFEENIRLTKIVADHAHRFDVTVEGELGTLSGVEEETGHTESMYTDPARVEEFVKRSGVDSLAVSVGTAHGLNKIKARPGETLPPLRFDILEEIKRRVPGFPVVLHGSSALPGEYVEMINRYGGALEDVVGIPEEQVREAARSCVCKVNIASDALLVTTAMVRKTLSEDPAVFDTRKYMGRAREELVVLYRRKNREVLGSAGSAGQAPAGH